MTTAEADVAPKQTYAFQTEVKQLLHLVVHALYSHKEIFLRELISNAADALDKLRFKALSDNNLYEQDSDLKIRILVDKAARTLTISDNGVGMTREEATHNLGTIARSGTAEFVAQLSAAQKQQHGLIGQFGVGFYSAFMVADKVTVVTRAAGQPIDAGVRWESEGTGEFSLESVDKATRGTDVILHLKADENSFLDIWQLRSLIQKYSNHIAWSIELPKQSFGEKEGEEKAAEEPSFEVVNKATALWLRPKQEITDDEYKEFYKHVAHDFAEPLLWSHNKVEGKHEYTTLLYIPGQAPFDMWNRDKPRGLKLYVQRVFIMDDAEVFLPNYLRFVRGVIDSQDLPLNVSRELLQDNKQTEAMRQAIAKRVLGMLEKLATDDPQQYQTFWQHFGQVLKEGLVEDTANREMIAKLMRFASTHYDTDAQTVSLQDYLTRVPKEQDKIYYLTAENFASAKHSPHLEIFRKKSIEVLLLTDRIDEWVVQYLTEFEGKSLQSVARGSLDLGELADKEQSEQLNKQTEDYADLLKRVQTILGDKVKEVRLTDRLTSSPACIVRDQNGMGSQMARWLKASGQEAPLASAAFELNPDHAIIQRLNKLDDNHHLEDWTVVLFEQAMLAEGGQLSDPAGFHARLNKLLLQVVN